jgi:23S rRNA (guanine745-N1)-methyltransferase
MANNHRVSIWACPVCKLPLTKPCIGPEKKSEKTLTHQWLCDNQHSFDIAKEGYINLLLPQQKRSSSPGDTKFMVSSRQNFLSKGYYQPLSEKITELASSHLETNSILLDSGCGEGYYLEQLLARKNDIHVFGIDISKEATKIASRLIKNGYFAVASSFNLPILTNSVDCLLRIFAPGDNIEAARVLKKTGVLIIISPGPRHLFALKKLLYKEAREHTSQEALDNFSLLDEKKVSYQLEIKDTKQVGQLVSMTPLYWQTGKTSQASLNILTSLNTEIDFVIRIYRPIKDNAWATASIKQ